MLASFPIRPAGVSAAGLLWLSLAVRHPQGSHSRLRVRTRRALVNDSAVTSVDDLGIFKPRGFPRRQPLQTLGTLGKLR